MVLRRNISYGTQTAEGTQAWDTFLWLVVTTRKLGVSFFEYVRDRLSQLGEIGILAQMLRDKAMAHPLGRSWNTSLLVSPDY